MSDLETTLSDLDDDIREREARDEQRIRDKQAPLTGGRRASGRGKRAGEKHKKKVPKVSQVRSSIVM